MDENFLRILRCPHCAGTFTLSASQQNAGDGGYAVLSCFCGRYPVVAGIPILKKGTISPGHSADDVVALIDAKRYTEALLAVLTPPPPSAAVFAPSLIRALPSFRGMTRFKGLFGQSGLRTWRERTEALLTKPIGKQSFTELLEMYYCQSDAYSDVVHRSGYYDYFSRRLGQARYIATLSIAKVVQQSKGPVLDLGCGLGHIARHLTRWAGGQLVVGVDYDFMLVYIAKNCLAPKAQYVCAGADISVPFADHSYALTVCSDAFSLFLYQASCMREMRRVTAEDGVMILSPVRNGAVKRDLYKGVLPSVPPEGIEAMVGDMPHRLITNRSIMERYLRKQGPPLESPMALSEFGDQQWLSLVASYRSDVFRDYPSFEEWPHIEGSRLGINPLYVEQGRDASGNVRLRREFPSAWYEQENASEDGKYSPESVTVSSKGMVDIAQGKRTPEIEELIQQRVVLGFPDLDATALLQNAPDMLVAAGGAGKW